ncbi:YeeE/YedE family protein [Vibrio hippocampi]|uniref:Sulphur transport domain-containing protein n=1 Tax=Vibrio hippocampi TaxID=654686 RepID=A0ABN8DRG1_9VIBR|nr:YeeE/YedE family protein [Vibrio hippocampi]CAH0529602.1 hypothetical protein VHP8226_03357 [Vibrio hippocampi]
MAFPWLSLIGGMLLGVSASLLLLFNGKVAGISGIVSGTFFSSDRGWRVIFLLGMVLGGFVASHWIDISAINMVTSPIMIIFAGLLVGLGTSLGNGCTSGHGICGMGRLSIRSIAATCVFMLVAMLTTFVSLHLFG